MRKISVSEIQGNEILAKDIYTPLDTILMCAGTPIRKEYAKRLEKLDVEYIYVNDELSEGINDAELIELQIRMQCEEAVKDTLEKYAYCGNTELEKLRVVAAEIIHELLKQPEVMYSVEGIRKKSELVYSHSLNVCALSVFLGLRMNLSQKQLLDMATGALLHDIGYNSIDTKVRFREHKDLTEKDSKIDRMHVVEGYSAMEEQSWLSENAKKVILSHHERLDGSGYPFHLTDKKIGIEEKIVAVCDTFDRRVYGIRTEKQKVYEVIEYIIGMGGKKFDKKVVDVFNHSIAAYPNGTMVITNQGETGIILRQNKNLPTRPVIRILKDKNGKKYNDWIEKDLKKELTLFIKDTVE